MFQHFSFDRPARLYAIHDGLGMDGDLSPTSLEFPPDETSFPPEQQNILPLESISLTELTNRFEQHNIRTRSSCCRPPWGNTDLSSQQVRLSSECSSRLSIRRQRQKLARRQCSSTHLTEVAALAESILRDGRSGIASIHPSSFESNSSSEAPSYMSSPTLSTVSSTTSLESLWLSRSMSPSEDGEAPCVRTCPQSHSARVSKRSRRRTSTVTLRGQDLVSKEIRLRRKQSQS